jgi:hypothetical protein
MTGARQMTPQTIGIERPASAPLPGPSLFARYAFGPNRLGYCGPDATDELLGEAAAGVDEHPLRELARGFEGAWPYLELIAHSNGLDDPLDRRVVEAYWLGNSLLEAVSPAAMSLSIATWFRPRAGTDEWPWLAEKPGAGAVPIHAFHVLDVFPRIGLLRSGSTDGALQVMDSCRIRWGRVIERDGSSLVVNAIPLVMIGGRLDLGPARVERIEAWRGGASFVDGAARGDVVAIHWSWACDRLSQAQLANLVRSTRHQIQVANLTI